MNFLCFAEAAHASNLDVENPGSANFKREVGVSRIENRFVETNRGSNRFLQPGMKIDFVVPKRLLDHEQVEGIEFAQVLNFVKRVSGICVHTENDIRPARPDFFE